MDPIEIMLDVYPVGDKWAICAGGFEDERVARAAARRALDIAEEIRVTYSPVNAAFYCWVLDERGEMRRDENGFSAPPDAEANWYLAPRGFYCVWSCGFGGENQAYAAANRAVDESNGWHCVGCGRIMSDAEHKREMVAFTGAGMCGECVPARERDELLGGARYVLGASTAAAV